MFQGEFSIIANLVCATRERGSHVETKTPKISHFSKILHANGYATIEREEKIFFQDQRQWSKNQDNFYDRVMYYDSDYTFESVVSVLCDEFGMDVEVNAFTFARAVKAPLVLMPCLCGRRVNEMEFCKRKRKNSKAPPKIKGGECQRGPLCPMFVKHKVPYSRRPFPTCPFCLEKGTRAELGLDLDGDGFGPSALRCPSCDYVLCKARVWSRQLLGFLKQVTGRDIEF